MKKSLRGKFTEEALDFQSELLRYGYVSIQCRVCKKRSAYFCISNDDKYTGVSKDTRYSVSFSFSYPKSTWNHETIHGTGWTFQLAMSDARDKLQKFIIEGEKKASKETEEVVPKD